MSPVMVPEEREQIAAPPPSALELGVIEEARRRQRRRRFAIAAALVVAVGLAIGIGVGIGGGAQRKRAARPRPPARSGAGAITSPSAIFAQDPYMGVACHIPNSIACDRVGLSVWLRRRAIAISATIAGAPLRLDDPTWSYVAHDGRRTLYVYAGFLQPAGLTGRLHVTPEPHSAIWLGDNAPAPLVRFRIDYGHGKVVVTQERVFLSAGWG